MASSATTLPSLPRGRRPSFSRHRNDVNASRAVALLTQVNQAVGQWHQELRQVLADIEAVYLAGPIVEGWLEALPSSSPSDPDPSAPAQAALLRHGDPDHLAAYVDHLARDRAVSSSGGQYRLCSLDADGRLQCQLCPPDQLGIISQGIARHQQIRTLVSRKQTLETALQQAAIALEQTCHQLGITQPQPS